MGFLVHVGMSECILYVGMCACLCERREIFFVSFSCAWKPQVYFTLLLLQPLRFLSSFRHLFLSFCHVSSPTPPSLHCLLFFFSSLFLFLSFFLPSSSASLFFFFFLFFIFIMAILFLTQAHVSLPFSAFVFGENFFLSKNNSIPFSLSFLLCLLHACMHAFRSVERSGR